ncbi:MAG: toll-Interleukin receptor [Ahrensia sp.]|nr:toll-Interleukin receptor [Ahrensia sp.]
MAFYRASDLRNDGLRVAARNLTTAEAGLDRRTASISEREVFDIFLSHSFRDARIILGIAEVLESQGVRVYVDWLVDSQLNRSEVNAATARLLRKRMGQCKSLIFATSTSSPSSKWMPWELGYFDGLNGSNISIMPIEEHDTPGKYGQEYLELYPAIEKLPVKGAGSIAAAVRTDGRAYMGLRDFAQGSNRYIAFA